MTSEARTLQPCPGCEGERTQIFDVEGLDCASEAAVIEGRLARLQGVCAVRTAPTTGKATVVHTLEDGAIESALAEVGFKVKEQKSAEVKAPSPWTTVLASALCLSGFALQALGFAVSSRAAFLAVVLVGGSPLALKGLKRARAGILDMNALMTIAVLGALAIGEWSEAAATVALFSLAQFLEARSLRRARQALSGLLSLTPETALLCRDDGREERVPAKDVVAGDVVAVAPGERFPVDGIVERGESEVDQSPVTGESVPVLKEPGTEVYAGSINTSSVLRVKVTRAAAETTLARIVRRVESAQASRAPSQGFVDRFARVYTPSLVVLAALVAVVPPLLALGSFTEWSYRALVLLVIACPCALVISTPVAIVSALTAASRRGVLVKGGAHLEAMGTIRAVVFDKTGTLTLGVPHVAEVLATGDARKSEALRLAAALEARSGHPLGRAVLERAREEGVEVAPADDVALLPGRGLSGTIEGGEVLVGSHRLFDERGLCDHAIDSDLDRLEAQGMTAVLVGRSGPPSELVGAMGVSDKVRPEAASALRSLRASGVAVSMMTGDNRRTARSIAEQLGIEDWSAELLPEDKVARVKSLLELKGSVAMVGDGVNDAPALASASVGVAMGRGTDVALETADIALMGNDLGRIAEVVLLGRAARRRIRENISFSLFVKALVLGLALCGLGSLWAAVAADMGASLLVVANGLRLLDPPRG